MLLPLHATRFTVPIHCSVHFADIGEAPSQVLYTDAELSEIRNSLYSPSPEKSTILCLKEMLQKNGWSSNEAIVRALRKPLLRNCAHYLYVVKRRSFAFNPVGTYVENIPRKLLSSGNAFHPNSEGVMHVPCTRYLAINRLYLMPKWPLLATDTWSGSSKVETSWAPENWAISNRLLNAALRNTTFGNRRFVWHHS